MAKKKPNTSVHALPVVLGAIAAIGVAYLVNHSRTPDAIQDIPTFTSLDQPPKEAPEITPEEGLINWVKDRGGRIGFDIRTPPGGERGAYALRDYKIGDEVAFILASSCIALENNGGFAAEHAHELAQRMAKNLTFLATFSPYLSTLPMPHQVLTSETFSNELVEALQSSELENIVNRERAVMAAVYFGRYKSSEEAGPRYAPLPELLGRNDSFDLHLYSHLTALISSREFSFHNEDGTRAGDHLVPVIDMLNNDPDKLNTRQFTDGKAMYIRAIRPISAGEELYLPYLPGLDHRNDMSLTGYGFIRKLKRPILPATDLPTFDPENPYEPLPLTDAPFYGPEGSHNSVAEILRLQGLLSACGTTLKEDEALLKSGKVTENWKMRTVIEFRVERKKAMQLAIRAIEEELLKRQKEEE